MQEQILAFKIAKEERQLTKLLKAKVQMEKKYLISSLKNILDVQMWAITRESFLLIDDLTSLCYYYVFS